MWMLPEVDTFVYSIPTPWNEDTSVYSGTPMRTPVYSGTPLFQPPEMRTHLYAVEHLFEMRTQGHLDISQITCVLTLIELHPLK